MGGVDLVNYTEMHHPMSHHNVACGKDNPNVFPTDLEKARKEAILVQKGFYSKETFELKNGYVSQQKPGRVLAPLDPRIAAENMLAQPNTSSVQVDSSLMEEIEHANHLRAYQRGLRADPPAPRQQQAPPANVDREALFAKYALKLGENRPQNN